MVRRGVNEEWRTSTSAVRDRVAQGRLQHTLAGSWTHLDIALSIAESSVMDSVFCALLVRASFLSIFRASLFSSSSLRV